MSEQTALREASRPTPPLHAMQTDGRTREPRVEAQIRQLLMVSNVEFWRRAEVRDHRSADWIQEETLVGLLRIREREGDTRTADRIAELLIDRTARKIARQIACWKLAPHHADECLQDVQSSLIEAIYSGERNHEFWEVRFWVCLERRINNAVRKYHNVTTRELSLQPMEDEEGHQAERLEQFQAPIPVTPQERVEAGEALAVLTENERIAFVLYNGEQWSQQEIADHLQVSDRTVRNLLVRAHKRLEPWRTESLH
jgi:RNA polymerase sigma factor (sigma-70 family)